MQVYAISSLIMLTAIHTKSCLFKLYLHNFMPDQAKKGFFFGPVHTRSSLKVLVFRDCSYQIKLKIACFSSLFIAD